MPLNSLGTFNPINIQTNVPTYKIYYCTQLKISPTPPRVTLCSIDTLWPTTAVSPITTPTPAWKYIYILISKMVLNFLYLCMVVPVPWSIINPEPIFAPGWISIWNTWLALLCKNNAVYILHSRYTMELLILTVQARYVPRVSLPVFHNQCDTRCVWRAWNPLKYSKTSG